MSSRSKQRHQHGASQHTHTHTNSRAPSFSQCKTPRGPTGRLINPSVAKRVVHVALTPVYNNTMSHLQILPTLCSYLRVHTPRHAHTSAQTHTATIDHLECSMTPGGPSVKITSLICPISTCWASVVRTDCGRLRYVSAWLWLWSCIRLRECIFILTEPSTERAAEHPRIPHVRRAAHCRSTDMDLTP